MVGREINTGFSGEIGWKKIDLKTWEYWRKTFKLT